VGDPVKGSFRSGHRRRATGDGVARPEAAGHDACWSSRWSRPSKIFRRPTWPFSAASSR
jgi:hypothetical protein